MCSHYITRGKNTLLKWLYQTSLLDNFLHSFIISEVSLPILYYNVLKFWILFANLYIYIYIYNIHTYISIYIYMNIYIYISKYMYIKYIYYIYILCLYFVVYNWCKNAHSMYFWIIIIKHVQNCSSFFFCSFFLFVCLFFFVVLVLMANIYWLTYSGASFN